MWTKREQFLFKTQNWKISCTFFYILNFNLSQKPKNQILALNTFMTNDTIFRIVINWLTFVHIKTIKNIQKKSNRKFFSNGKNFPIQKKFHFPIQIITFSTFKTILCYALSLWPMVATPSLIFCAFYCLFSKIHKNRSKGS